MKATQSNLPPPVQGSPNFMTVGRNGVRFTVETPEKIDRDFWRKFDDRWERETIRLFDAMLGPGRLMLDIGGWIGPTTLYAAGLGAGVTVFEPDPKAHAKLARNIARNPELAGRVTVVQAALNSHNGSARLYSNQLGNSMSGLIHGPGKHARQSTDVRSIDGRDPWIEELVATADLVKIDIEGGEFMLIPWIAAMLQRHRPTLYLSLHAFFLPGYMDKADRQRRLLAALGFYDYVYRAVEGEWIRLSSPWDTLAAEAETSGLQGSLLLSMEPVAGLNAEREAAAEI